MSKIYAPAPSGVAERVAHLVKVFHSDLHNAGIKVDLISVADDDPDVEDALKVRGIPAYACVRVVDIKGRTMGRGDAEIVLDEGKWLTLPDATRDAVLDHEIEHLELQVNPKSKKPKLDCRGRPKLKIKLHDAEFGWFNSIARRHGAASIECRQASLLFLTHTQTFFAFVGEARAIESAKRFVDSVPEGMKMTLSTAGHEPVVIDKTGA